MGKAATRYLTFVSLLAVVLIAVLVGGCGSSSDSSSSSSSSTEATETGGSETTTEGGSESAGVAEAKKFVSENSDLESLDWPEPPNSPYDPGRGKIAIVTCGLGGGCLKQAEAAQKAVTAAGWESPELADGKFTPSVQSGLVERYVQEGVDGILLISIEPDLIKSAVASAEKAGIPMACVTCAPSPEFPATGGKIPFVTATGKKEGEAIANYLVANSGGDASLILFENESFQIVIERDKAINQVLAEKCPDCSVESVPFPTEEFEKPGPPAFSAAMASHPEGTVDWVVTPSDTFSIPMVKTADQLGREVKITGMDADPEFLELINSTPVANATVYVPYAYEAWSGVDQVIRQAAGLKPWKSDDNPVALVTKENVAAPLEAAPELYTPKSFDFEAMYEKLWSGKS